MNARTWIWTVGWWIWRVISVFNHNIICIAMVDGEWVFIPVSAHHLSLFQFISSESFLNSLVFFPWTIFWIFQKTSSSHSLPPTLSWNLSERKISLCLSSFLLASPVVVRVSSLLCMAIKHPMHILCLWWWTSHTVGGVYHWGRAVLTHHESRGVSSLGWMGRKPRCCLGYNVAYLNLAKVFTSNVTGLWTQKIIQKS